MSFSRPAFALSKRRFGRGPARFTAEPAKGERRLSDDLKLFAGTFATGFLFVSILIG
jgi:hypothetical protein